VSDINSNDATFRLILGQLAPSHRSRSHVPNLSSTTIIADRGYWNERLLTELVIPSGISVLGTHKRDHTYPFTMDQVLSRNDKRILIQKKGSKIMRIMYRQREATKFMAIAYRDGHGKVVLGLASGEHCHPTKHWDLHLKNFDDRRKIMSRFSFEWDVLETWIKNHDPKKDISDTFRSFIQRSQIQAVTTGGSKDSSWFICRAFSFTSSTSDGIINAITNTLSKHGSSTFEQALVVPVEHVSTKNSQ